MLELGGLGLPLSRIVTKLKAAEHLHLELRSFDCSKHEAAEAGLPALGVEACVFTFLSDLETRDAVACLGGIWRLLVDLPRQPPLPFGRVAQRPTRGELTAKRRDEAQATLRRTAAKLGSADRDEFESGIKEWWTRPLVGPSTSLDIIAVRNYQWERLKKQLAAIENALDSDTPDLSEPLDLPMSAAIAAHAARAAIIEREKGLLHPKTR